MNNNHTKDKETLRELTAEELISILSGEKEHDPKYREFYGEYEGVSAVIIDHVKIIEDIVLAKDFKTSKAIIIIKGGEFQTFNIYGGEFQDFYIDGGEFQYFRIDSGKFQFFNINDGIFKDFNIFDGEFQVFFVEGGIFKDFNISNGEFQDFFVRNGEFQYFKIDGGEFKHLTFDKKINNGASIIKLELHNGTFAEFNLSVNLLGVLKLKSFDGLNARIYSSDIREIHLSGAGNATLNLEDLNPERIRFDGLQNNGCLYLTRIAQKNSDKAKRVDYEFKDFKVTDKTFTIRPKKQQREVKLSFINSELGHCQFKHFNFEYFHQEYFHQEYFHQEKPIEVSASNFSSTLFLASEFPTKLGTVKIIKEEENRGFYHLYRSLSLAADKQKDIAKRFDFHALSQKYYYKHLNWRNNPSQKISIAFSCASNDFGKNWLRPILLLLGFNLLSVSFYIFFNVGYEKPFDYVMNSGCLATFAKFIATFAEYLIPTHSLEFFHGKQTTDIAKTWDILSRLINGLLIYQTIVAFRIFSRR